MIYWSLSSFVQCSVWSLCQSLPFTSSIIFSSGLGLEWLQKWISTLLQVEKDNGCKAKTWLGCIVKLYRPTYPLANSIGLFDKALAPATHAGRLSKLSVPLEQFGLSRSSNSCSNLATWNLMSGKWNVRCLRQESPSQSVVQWWVLSVQKSAPNSFPSPHLPMLLTCQISLFTRGTSPKKYNAKKPATPPKALSVNPLIQVSLWWYQCKKAVTFRHINVKEIPGVIRRL